MNKYSIRLKNSFYFLALITLFVWILITAKIILVPMLFSVLLALFLKPIVDFFQHRLRRRIPSIFIAYIVAVIPLLALIFFFINQARVLFSELPSSREKLQNVLITIADWVDQKFALDEQTTSNWIGENFISSLDVPVNLIRESLQSTTTLAANTVLVVVITYFLLLYKTAFRNYILTQVTPANRKSAERLFNNLQGLTKRYLVGQGIVILILGFLIGSGLWLIGVPYPYFWGFLAGFLEIIPYVGTTIGGVLPFLYMLVLADNLWQPLAVVALYIFVQQIEGNFISPNIMGPSIKINPLFIILGLFAGGIIWGIAGMILALPILAISKELLRSFEITRPWSYLMENGLSRKSEIFLKQFDTEKHRFINLLFREEKESSEENTTD